MSLGGGDVALVLLVCFKGVRGDSVKCWEQVVTQKSGDLFPAAGKGSAQDTYL